MNLEPQIVLEVKYNKMRKPELYFGVFAAYLTDKR
jgi:hypothetical protein